jgi:hypothetical protein
MDVHMNIRFEAVYHTARHGRFRSNESGEKEIQWILGVIYSWAPGLHTSNTLTVEFGSKELFIFARKFRAYFINMTFYD